MQRPKPASQVHVAKVNEDNDPNPIHLVEVNKDNDSNPDSNLDIQNCFDAFSKDPPEKYINACEVINMSINSPPVEEEWFLDSGAFSHVIANSRLVSTIRNLCFMSGFRIFCDGF